MRFGLFAVAFVGSAVGLWLLSQITETLRPLNFTQLRRTKNIETEESCCDSNLLRFAGASEATSRMDVSQAINFRRVPLLAQQCLECVGGN